MPTLAPEDSPAKLGPGFDPGDPDSRELLVGTTVMEGWKLFGPVEEASVALISRDVVGVGWPSHNANGGCWGSEWNTPVEKGQREHILNLIA